MHACIHVHVQCFVCVHGVHYIFIMHIIIGACVCECACKHGQIYVYKSFSPYIDVEHGGLALTY